MASANPHRSVMSIGLRDFERATPQGIVARLRGFLGFGMSDETPEEASDRLGAERRAAARELASLEVQRVSELAKLDAAENAARRRLEVATPAYRAAVAAHDRAQAMRVRRTHDLDYGRQRLLRRIEVACDPEIDVVQRDLIDLLHLTLETKILVEERNTLFDLKRASYLHQLWSNTSSIDARRVAILALRAELEEWKAEPEQEGVRERMAARIEALPDANTMVMVRDYPPEPRPERPEDKKPRTLVPVRDRDDPELLRSHASRFNRRRAV